MDDLEPEVCGCDIRTTALYDVRTIWLWQTLEGDQWGEEKIDVGLLDKMSDQQLGQMYELMLAIRRRGRESADEEIEGRGKGRE